MRRAATQRQRDARASDPDGSALGVAVGFGFAVGVEVGELLAVGVGFRETVAGPGAGLFLFLPLLARLGFAFGVLE